MPINIDQWHVKIGSFIEKIESVRTASTRYYRYLNIINYTFLTHGDIEANPGPTKKHLITFHDVTMA